MSYTAWTVTFDSITVHDDHEGFGRGSGEFELIAYVHGFKIDLTEVTGFEFVEESSALRGIMGC